MVRAGAQGSGAAGRGARGGSPGWAGRVLAVLRRALVPSCCSRGSTQPGHLGRAVHKRSAGAPGLTESLSCRLLADLCQGQDTV